MWSIDVVGWIDIATAEQYNRLKKDAEGASYMLVHQQNTPDDTFRCEPGHWDTGTGIADVALFDSAPVTAPVVNPRIDLVSVDNTWAIIVTTGTEAPTPSVPNTPTGNIPLAYIFLRAWGTLILSEDDGVNHYIVDRRPFLSLAGTGGSAKHIHTQPTASATWTVTHGKGTADLLIQVWGLDNKTLWYEEVEIIDPNNIEITFTAPVAGRAVVL